MLVDLRVAGRRGPQAPGAPRGHTLVSLAAVCSVLAVLAALAAPSLAGLIAQQRVRAATAALHGALLQARSEAIKRNEAVTLSAAGGDWAQGWSLSSASGQTLRSEPAVRVGLAASVSAVTFSPLGRVSAGAGLFEVQDPGSPARRCLALDSTGRVRVREAAAC